MPRISNHPKGSSLIEVMVAVVICLIVIMGGFSLFVYGRKQIDIQGNGRVAVHLAAQKLEELKAGPYNNVTEGQTTERISLERAYYDRTVQTEDLGQYKQITVSVNWLRSNQNHDISLTTLVAP